MPSATEAPARAAFRLPFGLCLTCVVLAGLAVALATGGSKALFIDEYFSVLESVGQAPLVYAGELDREFSSREIWASNDFAGVYRSVMAGDNGNMSAFAFLSHIMTKALGASRPLVLQIVPIAAFLASIVWSYRLGRLLFSRPVGLLAALLCMANFTLIQFATEVRAYGLGIALCLIATECFVRIVGLNRQGNEAAPPAPRFWCVLYAGATLAALFTHFLSVMIIAGHVAYAVLAVRDRRTWVRLAVSGAFVAAVFLPVHRLLLSSENYSVVDDYFAYLQSQGKKSRKSFTPKHVATAVGGSAFQLSGMPALAGTMAAAVLPVGAFGLAVVFPGMRRGIAGAARPLVLLGILAFVCLSVSLVTLALGFALFPVNRRYQVFSIPYFAVGMAWLLRQAWESPGPRWAERSRRAFAAAYVGVLLLSPVLLVRQAMTVGKPESYEIVARDLAAKVAAGSVAKVVVPTVLDFQMLAFRMGPGADVRFEVEDRALTLSLTRKLEAMKLSHPIALFDELRYAYEDNGEAFAELQPESDIGGVVRIGYGKKP